MPRVRKGKGIAKQAGNESVVKEIEQG